LAVIALAVGQPEETLLQDRVAPVPERQRKGKALVIVRDSEQPVLPPPVGARAGAVVRKVVPGRAARAVVLAHRPPLALGQVRPPALPMSPAFPCFVESL